MIGLNRVKTWVLIAALGYPGLRRWQQRRAAVARREGGV